SKLTLALDKLDELENRKNREKKLLEKQKRLQDLGLDKKFKEQDTYNKEKERILNRSKKEFLAINELLQDLKRAIDETDLQYLDENSLNDLINTDILKALKPTWTEYLTVMKQAIEQ